jgi:LAS superfamily LD-carboxypeptidase LdcB
MTQWALHFRRFRWRITLYAFYMTLFSLIFWSTPAFSLDLEGKDPAQIALVESIRQTLEPTIKEKKLDGSVLVLTFEELYQPLNEDQKKFMDSLRKLKPQNAGSIISNHQVWIWLKDQVISKDGATSVLDAQVLPKETYEAYVEMNEAMKKELGKGLLVESGYRSPAYQLYLFVFFMPNHAYSVSETERHVALPGRSEHGRPNRQAIDFINEQGINGEYNPEEFEALPEYAWLVKNAKRFGFALSYPRGGSSAFEPWHWHYEKRKA